MKSLIIYRCCDAELTVNEFKGIRPSWFNKLKCFKSYWNDYENYRDSYDFLVVHDGDKKSFYEYIASETSNIIKVNYKSNNRSLYETFNIAEQGFKDKDYKCVHFIEDDFLARPGFLHTVQRGSEYFGLVTGFDHLDRYKRSDDVSFGKEYIAFLKSTNCHWRTAESTTCTWSCSRGVWDTIQPTVRKHGLEDRELFRELIKQNIRLWTPMPGYSTTLDINTLSPGINWKQVNDLITL